VYETDALATRRVRVVGVFPENSHLAHHLSIALTAQPSPKRRICRVHPRPAGDAAFKAYGFTPLR